MILAFNFFHIYWIQKLFRNVYVFTNHITKYVAYYIVKLEVGEDSASKSTFQASDSFLEVSILKSTPPLVDNFTLSFSCTCWTCKFCHLFLLKFSIQIHYSKQKFYWEPKSFIMTISNASTSCLAGNAYHQSSFSPLDHLNWKAQRSPKKPMSNVLGWTTLSVYICNFSTRLVQIKFNYTLI